MIKKISITILVFALTIFCVNNFLLNFIDKIIAESLITSDIPIDVVFLSTEKDFDTLVYSVKSVRKYLKQPIKKIVLIAPKSDLALEVAKTLNIEYIDEDILLKNTTWLNYVKDNKLSKNYFDSSRKNDWNWYYQQFLKLLYYKISESDYFLIIDSDVLINRPVVFVSKDIQTFFISSISTGGLDTSTISAKELLGESQYVPEFSFISNLMIFNKNIVNSLIKKIETKFSTDFYKAAILVEQNTKARFSEYELYAVYANYSNDTNDKRLSTNFVPTIERTRKRSNLFFDQYSLNLKKYPYISYHHWRK